MTAGRKATGEMCACGEGTVGLVQREGDTMARHRADVCGWGEAALAGRETTPEGVGEPYTAEEIAALRTCTCTSVGMPPTRHAGWCPASSLARERTW